MRRRGLLIGVLLALGLGLAAGAIVMRQSARTSPAQTKQEKTAKVVVMAKKLPRGVKLKTGDVQLREWPERLLNPQFIKNINLVVGRVVVANMVIGEPVLQDKLAEIGSKEGLSTFITPGRRAFSMRVKDDTGVAGFLLPGSRVDVHATLEKEVEKQKSQLKEKTEITLGNKAKTITMTKTILQDVEVLAAGAEQEAGGKKGRITATVVTLLLTPEESDRLALSATVGTLWLSMRNPRDRVKTDIGAVSVNDIFNIEEEAVSATSPGDSKPKPAIKKNEPKKPSHVIEIIQGGVKTKVEF